MRGCWTGIKIVFDDLQSRSGGEDLQNRADFVAEEGRKPSLSALTWSHSFGSLRCPPRCRRAIVENVTEEWKKWSSCQYTYEWSLCREATLRSIITL